MRFHLGKIWATIFSLRSNLVGQTGRQTGLFARNSAQLSYVS
jgi:hypothetical protein